MKLRSALLPVLGAATSVAGCARDNIYAAEPQEIRRAQGPVGEPYVPAGTTVRVQMNQPIGTAVSFAGDRWTATVVEPVRARDGSILIPRGATVHGTVLEVDTGTTPSVKLDIATVDTRLGSAPLEARIARAETTEYPGPDEIDDGYGYGWGFDPYGFGYDPYLGYDAAFYPYADVNADEVQVPEDATLVLQLTRPLIPGATRDLSVDRRP